MYTFFMNSFNQIKTATFMKLGIVTKFMSEIGKRPPSVNCFNQSTPYCQTRSVFRYHSTLHRRRRSGVGGAAVFWLRWEL